MQDRTEEIIKRLIRANIERKDRNLSAERSVHRPEVKSVFKEFAEQSEGFLGELYMVVRTYGGNMGDAASVSLDIDAFDFRSCDSDHAILINWSNWEEEILAVYQQIMDDSNVLDNTLFEKIRAQKNELSEAKERIAQFRMLME